MRTSLRTVRSNKWRSQPNRSAKKRNLMIRRVIQSSCWPWKTQLIAARVGLPVKCSRWRSLWVTEQPEQQPRAVWTKSKTMVIKCSFKWIRRRSSRRRRSMGIRQWRLSNQNLSCSSIQCILWALTSRAVALASVCRRSSGHFLRSQIPSLCSQLSVASACPEEKPFSNSRTCSTSIRPLCSQTRKLCKRTKAEWATISITMWAKSCSSSCPRR